MKKREAAIISAYTGVLCGEFDDMYSYIEEIMGRPILTHELGIESIMADIQIESKKDFLQICSNLEE